MVGQDYKYRQNKAKEEGKFKSGNNYCGKRMKRGELKEE